MVLHNKRDSSIGKITAWFYRTKGGSALRPSEVEPFFAYQTARA